MYINLFPHKQLVLIKKYLLIASFFMLVGGAYALYRELFIQDIFRLGWVFSSALILGAGVVSWLVGTSRLATRDAYFSMTPERIKYRLAVFAQEFQVNWKDIDTLEISAQAVVYHLISGESITMRLGNIQQPEVMLHVSRSIHLAAMGKGIMVNGVQTKKQNMNV